MLFYGDRSRTVATRERLGEIRRTLAEAEGTADRSRRRDLYTRALIDAGELAQGIADAEFTRKGYDDLSPTQDVSLELVRGIALRLEATRRNARTSAASDLAAPLVRFALPEEVVCKLAEGFAYYAVYPAAYASAARALACSSPLVIGLRSIGTALASVVAAASGARRAITMRPCGEPFRRELRLSNRLLKLLEAHDGSFAIVDEGPGLSGSSFGAVGDMLTTIGVSASRIVYFPSHGGDLGPQSSERHRSRWASARRPVATLDDLLRDNPMADWFCDLIGRAETVEDVSAGGWRAEGDERPAGSPFLEPRKFRLTTARGQFVARFVGLGRFGEAKFARARALFAGEFTAEPLALRRGMLLERWIDGEPLDLAGSQRAAFLKHLTSYLKFRAARFPAKAEDGGSLAPLRTMAVVNAREIGGEALANSVESHVRNLERFQGLTRPVHVDARLHRWKWLRLADGSFRKSDAIDHSCAHDLVGCQDIVWDLAGAAVEFQLSIGEERELASDLGIVSDLTAEADVSLFKALYAAFQIGAWTMAQAGSSPASQAAQQRQVERYSTVLRATALTGSAS